MRRLALVLIVAMASARLYADSKKLTEDQRIEILRGLNSEYAKIKVPLPRSKSALEVTTSGTRDEAKWKAAEKEYGPAGRVGDFIQVTRVDIGKDRIVLDLNGGIKGGRRFLDHVQIGMGTQTTPINGAPTNAPGGTSVALIFGGPIGEVTSAEIKKMLQPILDFEKESVTANYVDTLPEPIKEAVKAKKAIEGMNHDQVLLAVGKPVHKSRETKEGTEYEDWIYGEPPGRVTFVTFTGDKVVKVKETYAGLGGSVAETPQQP
jgi:hypothetical protein